MADVQKTQKLKDVRARLQLLATGIVNIDEIDEKIREGISVILYDCIEDLDEFLAVAPK